MIDDKSMLLCVGCGKVKHMLLLSLTKVILRSRLVVSENFDSR